MVANTKDRRKKPKEGDDLLMFAMVGAGGSLGPSMDADMFGDLLEAAGISFGPASPETAPAPPSNPVMDVVGNAASMATNGLMMAGVTAAGTSAVAGAINARKKPALDVDIDLDAPKRTTPQVDLPDVKGGHGRFGAILGTAATGLTLGTVITSATQGDQPDIQTGEFNLAAEFGHYAQVLGHGVQNGLVSFTGAPEDIWDMVDGWTGGWLWGDHTTNSTTEAVGQFADEHLIQAPELRNDFERAMHSVGEYSTYLIPLSGVAKFAGAGAQAVNAVRVADIAWDASSVNALGIGLTGQNIPQMAGAFAANAAEYVNPMAYFGGQKAAPAPNLASRALDMA